MIDEQRIYRMSRDFQMSPEKARKLLTAAGEEPEIVRISRRYYTTGAGGDTNGDNKKCSGTVL